MIKSKQLIVGILATLLALASGIYIGLAPQVPTAQTLNVPPEAIKHFFSAKDDNPEKSTPFLCDVSAGHDV